jgi:hypothetical protein
LEFVESLGSLYRKAKAAPLAIGVTFGELRTQLIRRLGLPADISDADLARETGLRLGWKEEELLGILTRARSGAAANKFSSSEALELVQTLQRFSGRLAS